MNMKKHDWTEIEHAYVSGSESLRALASRFGVSTGDVLHRSKSGGWVQKRKDYRAEVISNSLQKSLRAREDEIADVMEGTELVNRRVLEILSSEDCLQILMNTRQPGRELESLSKAMANVDELRRLVRGIMNPRDAERSKLERERFEHEKAKDAAANDKDTQIRVVLDGDIGQWAK